MTGFCKLGNELSVSVKDGQFLGQVSNYQLLKETVVRVITVRVRTQ